MKDEILKYLQVNSNNLWQIVAKAFESKPTLKDVF